MLVKLIRGGEPGRLALRTEAVAQSGGEKKYKGVLLLTNQGKAPLFLCSFAKFFVAIYAKHILWTGRRAGGMPAKIFRKISKKTVDNAFLMCYD